MYAIIKSGGKQYRVQKGDSIRVESLHSKEGDKIEISEVLAIGKESSMQIGTPYVKGAKVKATVQGVGREKKITIIKFRRRKDSRLKQGHRQYYTELKIDSLTQSKSSTSKEATKATKE